VAYADQQAALGQSQVAAYDHHHCKQRGQDFFDPFFVVASDMEVPIFPAALTRDKHQVSGEDEKQGHAQKSARHCGGEQVV